MSCDLAQKAGRTPRHPSALAVKLGIAAVLCFPVVLKLWKAFEVSEAAPSLTDLADILAADVSLAFAWGAMALTVVRLLGASSRMRWWIWGGLAGSLVPILGLTAIEHETWVRTSSLLDWSLLSYTVRHFDDLSVVIASETHAEGLWLFGGAAALCLLPALCDRFAPEAMRLPPHWANVAILGVLSLGAAALSTRPPRAPELHPIRHSASLAIVFDGLSAAPAEASVVMREIEPVENKARLEERLDMARYTPDPSLPQNVLLVVLESTRYDATTPYSPRLRTMPRLQELADTGALVERAYVDMPHTSKALVSILCGYSPRRSVEINEARPAGLPSPCLAHVLSKVGYQTAFFQAATGTFENRRQLVENAGYDRLFARESYDETGFEETNYLSVEDKVMVKPILEWIDSNGSKPFLATVLTCITHHNYGLPNDFPIRQLARRDLIPRGQKPPREWSRFNRYLNTVKYSDEFLGDLLDGLRERGKLDDTLVVVLGDHGQGFHEHGEKAHNTVIYEEGLRVPLIINNPKLLPEPRRIRGIRRQVDVTPTILTGLGVRYPRNWFEGEDLLRAEGHRYAYSSCWYDRRCAAETGSEIKVVDHFDHRPMEVYNLVEDPFERRNLLVAGPRAKRKEWKKYARDAKRRMQSETRRIERNYSQAGENKPWLLPTEPDPGRRLSARLESHIDLIGFDAPTFDVDPGQMWDVQIYFRCLQPSPEGWRMFGVLRTPDGREYQVDHHPAAGRLELKDCAAGTIVADHVRVWIPDDVPPGPLDYFWGSVYLKERGTVRHDNKRIQRRQVVPLGRGVVSMDDSVRLARLNVRAPREGELARLLERAVLHEPPDIAEPLGIRVGDHLVLEQVLIDPPVLSRYGSANVTTVWRVEGHVPGPWQLFTHFHPAEARWSSRKLHTPVDGLHPISNWEPGTWVRDTYTLAIPHTTPPGEANLWGGVAYEDERMSVGDSDRLEVEHDRILLGVIQVKDDPTVRTSAVR